RPTGATTMKMMILVASLLLSSAAAFGQESATKIFDDNKVYYSAFNSSFISAEVASIYKITRGKDKGLVNIAVVPEGAEAGTTALVGGAVNNLIQQQQTLDFIEIREGEAVYYLAPFKFDNEDPLTFTIQARPARSHQTSTLTCQRTFYPD